jgi:hypothetical protein
MVRDRSGKIYKPSTIRSYKASLEHHVYPELGARKLFSITNPDLQDFCDRLASEGLHGSTIRNTMNPLRRILGQTASQPCSYNAVRERAERVWRRARLEPSDFQLHRDDTASRRSWKRLISGTHGSTATWAMRTIRYRLATPISLTLSTWMPPRT